MTARMVSNVGSAKRLLGDYPGALDYFQRSLQMAEELNDKKLIANALNNIGVVNRDQGNYGRALEYLQAAKAKDPRNVRALNALGVVYDKLGRFDLSAREPIR